MRLTEQAWQQIVLAVNQYAMHVTDAGLHASASRSDISQTAALGALRHLQQVIEAAVPVGPVAGDIVAWGMRSDGGQILDCISPKEHAREEGSYTVPLCIAALASPAPAQAEGLTDERDQVGCQRGQASTSA